MISWGMSLTLNLTYCDLGSKEQRYMLDISAVQYLAPGVERTDCQWHLIVSIDAE